MKQNKSTIVHISHADSAIIFKNSNKLPLLKRTDYDSHAC